MTPSLISPRRSLPSSRCFGRTNPNAPNGLVHAAYGSLKVMTAVLGSESSTVAICSQPARLRTFGPMDWSKVYRRSDAVMGVPSDQTAPGFRR